VQRGLQELTFWSTFYSDKECTVLQFMLNVAGVLDTSNSNHSVGMKSVPVSRTVMLYQGSVDYV